MKIAIVAGAPSCMEAPFYNPDWQIWAVGPAVCESLPVIHRYFEVHPLWYPHLDTVAFKRFLAETQAEIWAHFPEVHSGSVQYPIEAISERFGTEFLSSSVSWMLALAIHKQASVIGLWGVDLISSIEYRQQRPGVKHFIKIAELMGIEVRMPPDCPLLRDLPAYPPMEKHR